MAFTLSFAGTRVNASDANTNWNKVNVGGGAPAAEPQNAYQGTNMVGNLIKTAIGGVDYDPAAGAVDMTAANRQLWFVKCVITDYADLVATIGAEIWMGSGNGDYYVWVVAGTNANRSRFDQWPSQGGFLIFGLNPEVSAWRESTTGSPSLTAVDYFAFLVDTQNGNAKSENMGLDAIDIGTGLLLYGTAPTTDGFQAFVEYDQNNTSNRYGVVLQPGGAGSPITVNGRLDIGDGTNETDFSSDGETVVYPDGYHGAGDVGVLVDLGVANSVYSDLSTHIGLGSATTEDTRPDYVFTGTTGVATLSAVLTNFRNVTLTSAVDADGADIECLLLTQSSAEIQNSVIRTTSGANVATLQDPTFGTSDLHDTRFVQAGSGHAIEIGSTGTYNLTGLTFSGYNASDGQSDSVLFINVASGTVTINVNDGDTPTYRLPGGSTATVTINNTVTLQVTVIDEAGDPVENAQTGIYALETAGGVTKGDELISGTGGSDTNASGIVSNTAFNYVANVNVEVRSRKSFSADNPRYKHLRSPQVIGSTGLSVTVTLIVDPQNN